MGWGASNFTPWPWRSTRGGGDPGAPRILGSGSSLGFQFFWNYPWQQQQAGEGQGAVAVPGVGELRCLLLHFWPCFCGVPVPTPSSGGRGCGFGSWLPKTSPRGDVSPVSEGVLGKSWCSTRELTQVCPLPKTLGGDFWSPAELSSSPVMVVTTSPCH